MAKEELWEILYRSYKRDVLGVCLGILGHEEDAADAAEEAFIKAFRHADKLDLQGNVRGWLLRIAARTAIDMLRRRRRWQRLLSRLRPALRPRRGDPEREWRDELVREALARLDERYRLPLVLQGYGGLSYREIAATLGIAEGTVASRISRGKEILRREVLGYGEGD